MQEQKKQITRDDIFLMMESYRNMIENNLILLEKQDDVLKYLKELTNDFTKELVTMITENHKSCLKTRSDFVVAFTELIGSQKINNEREHNKQNLKMYGLIALLVSIIGTLLIVLHHIWPIVEK